MFLPLLILAMQLLCCVLSIFLHIIVLVEQSVLGHCLNNNWNSSHSDFPVISVAYVILTEI